MANITGTELEGILLTDLQGNVATDPPISTFASAGSIAAADTYKFLFDAAVRLYEMSGGTVKGAASSTLWTPDPSSGTTGKATGILTTISRIINLWATTTAASTGGGAGDVLLKKVELQELEGMRMHAAGLGSYLTPQAYAVSQIQTATAANVGLLQLDYWPGVTGQYFPAHYIPHLGQLAATTDVYDLPEIFQRDVPHVAALDVCDLIGRPEFKDAIMKKLSDFSRAMMLRRQSAMQDASQDQ